MTVKELIAELEKMPQDMQVAVYDPHVDRFEPMIAARHRSVAANTSEAFKGGTEVAVIL